VIVATPTRPQISDQDFDHLIQDALRQYEVYRELSAITSFLESDTAEEDYRRDMTHPLSIQLKG
jgi:ABC-type Fe3+-citrate transport system substrate-binding protein